MTVKLSYPFQRRPKCSDSLGEAHICMALNASYGYWQFKIDDQDKEKTKFTSHHSLYKLLRMPFGLRNALSTFHLSMNIILSAVKCQFAIVCLDDVFTFSRSLEEHLDDLRTGLKLLRRARVSLKMNRSIIVESRTDTLGHVIKAGRLDILIGAADGIRRLQHPTNVTEHKSFLGLCNVLTGFVPSFLPIAALLNHEVD